MQNNIDKIGEIYHKLVKLFVKTKGLLFVATLSFKNTNLIKFFETNFELNMKRSNIELICYIFVYFVCVRFFWVKNMIASTRKRLGFFDISSKYSWDFKTLGFQNLFEVLLQNPIPDISNPI